MIETSPQKPNPSPQHKPSMWTDFGPVIAYVLVFNIARKMIDKTAEFNLLGMSVPGEDAPLYIGTIVFAVAIITAVIYSKIKTGKVSVMLWVTAIIVLGTAAITLGLKSPTVFKMKPTAINLLFGITILGSLAIGKNVFRQLFANIYTLPDKVWRVFAFRWGLFFLFLAGVNEFIWRNFSVDFWSNFKLVGVLPITFLFILLNMPLLMKHMPDMGAKPPKP
ncbi:MAG: septation protein IspZ [Robiginitomaculum sp.]|nr:septation protein IspZ [Robiginitomaculum sp.]